MRLRVYSFGKLKTPGLRQTADHYLARARPWLNLEECELKPESPVSNKTAILKQCVEREGQTLLAQLQKNGQDAHCFFLLDEGGRSLSTEQWIKLFQGLEREGKTQIAFCIGGSFGLDPSLHKRARGVFSLGPQTLSYELTRVVFYEQIYRAWSAMQGHPYHHAGVPQ